MHLINICHLRLNGWAPGLRFPVLRQVIVLQRCTAAPLRRRRRTAATAAGTECRLSTNQRPGTASAPLCGTETIAFVIARRT